MVVGGVIAKGEHDTGPQAVRERLSREEAQQYAKRLESAWKAASESIKRA